MVHETLPADIATAIDTLVEAADHEAVMMGSDMTVGKAEARLNEAREALDAAILRHLRGETGVRDALVNEMTGG